MCSNLENITIGKTDVELCSFPCPGDSESFCGAQDYVSVYKSWTTVYELTSATLLNNRLQQCCLHVYC